MEFTEIRERIKAVMSDRRFCHSVGVAETARRLAQRWGEDPDKAYLAGLVHDCAREVPDAVVLKRAEEFGIVIDNIERQIPHLLHGAVGAAIAASEYGITDPLVLSAVEVHTTGDTKMTGLDIIVCLADYIEPGRDFPGVDRLRAASEVHPGHALRMALEGTIKYLIEIGAVIHPRTIAARNELLGSEARAEQGDRVAIGFRVPGPRKFRPVSGGES